MTHTPPTSPSHARRPPTPRPLRIKWVSEGYESIDMLAWLSARQKLKAPIGKARAVGLLAFYLIISLVALLSVLGGLIAGKPTLWGLGLFVLVVCALALLSLLRLLNPATFQARVIKMTRKSDAIESTAGRWTCAIGSGTIQFEWLDRGHPTRCPSAEITEVAIANDRVVLLAGKFIRGFFPVSALPPGDPEARVWAALRHVTIDTGPFH